MHMVTQGIFKNGNRDHELCPMSLCKLTNGTNESVSSQMTNTLVNIY